MQLCIRNMYPEIFKVFQIFGIFFFFIKQILQTQNFVNLTSKIQNTIRKCKLWLTFSFQILYYEIKRLIQIYIWPKPNPSNKVLFSIEPMPTAKPKLIQTNWLRERIKKVILKKFYCFNVLLCPKPTNHWDAGVICNIHVFYF